MWVDKFLDAIVEAIRDRVAGGESHRQVAAELNLERSLVSRIIRGERRIGMRTYATIMAANPPWLREVLAGNPALTWGSNGTGQEERGEQT